jgi:hypothetical protein
MKVWKGLVIHVKKNIPSFIFHVWRNFLGSSYAVEMLDVYVLCQVPLLATLSANLVLPAVMPGLVPPPESALQTVTPGLRSPGPAAQASRTAPPACSTLGGQSLSVCGATLQRNVWQGLQLGLLAVRTCLRSLGCSARRLHHHHHRHQQVPKLNSKYTIDLAPVATGPRY